MDRLAPVAQPIQHAEMIQSLRTNAAAGFSGEQPTDILLVFGLSLVRLLLARLSLDRRHIIYPPCYHARATVKSGV